MYFIASRLYSSKNKDKRKASQPAVLIATAGVALGVAVMLLSVAIVIGFKAEVGNKVSGFASDIEVLNIHSLQLPEANPIILPTSVRQRIEQQPGVAHVQAVSQKIGVLKTDHDFSAITLKGVAEDYDTTFLSQHIISGRFPRLMSDSASGEILISNYFAQRHNLSVGDKVYAYFFANTIKMRRFAIAGIYETHLQQFDRNFVLTDKFTVNKLNSWNPQQLSELEVRIHPSFSAQSVQLDLQKQLAGFPNLTVITAQEHYPQVYSWLDMLDLNAWVILVLMLSVAAFTMVSGTLILILEHTPTIGLLSALGATLRQLRGIFMQLALRIMVRGLVIGNILGLGLIGICRSSLISLDPATYYVESVPVSLSVLQWMLINAITIVAIFATLLVPTLIISKIQPSKAIKFD